MVSYTRIALQVSLRSPRGWLAVPLRWARSASNILQLEELGNFARDGGAKMV